MNAARAVGPGIGGILIATVGTGTCFLLNAASFVAVVTSLLLMDRSALRPSPPSGRARGQLREGLRYAARTPTIAVPLAMMGLVGLLAYEFSVSLPVLAQQSFHGGAEAYGFMTAAMGIGAVIGGLFTAARGRTGLRPMIFASAGFGLAILVCAFSPVLGLAYAALLFVGWASVSFIAIGNSTIQLSSEPSMRGRVLALWQVAFQGTTPVGGPAIGWIIALTDPRVGLAVGGASCFAAAIGGAALARRYRRAGPPKAIQLESPASAGPVPAVTPVELADTRWTGNPSRARAGGPDRPAGAPLELRGYCGQPVAWGGFRSIVMRLPVIVVGNAGGGDTGRGHRGTQVG